MGKKFIAAIIFCVYEVITAFVTFGVAVHEHNKCQERIHAKRHGQFPEFPESDCEEYESLSIALIVLSCPFLTPLMLFLPSFGGCFWIGIFLLESKAYNSAANYALAYSALPGGLLHAAFPFGIIKCFFFPGANVVDVLV